MRSNVQQRPATPDDVGLGPKKTFLVLFTVVGCIAILFPKIFYPMMVGPAALKQDQAGRVPPNLQKQERPPHMKELIHPGMQERGRAIPPHPSVPIIERPGRPGGLPGNIERRPGAPMIPGQPGPNLRAASYQAQHQHQQQQKGASQSIIMPIYTFGIVAFFVFTVVKILLKKTGHKDQGPQMESDPNFVEKVFKAQPEKKKLVYTAIQGIIDATNQQLTEIERECAEKNVEHTSSNHKNEERENDHEKTDADTKLDENVKEKAPEMNGDKEEEEEKAESSTEDLLKINGDATQDAKSEHDIEVEKRLNHLKEAMHIRSVENIENSDLKSIYLEGELPHDPKILVSATETESKMERISSHYPSVKDVADDEAVILSGLSDAEKRSKMA